jgi:hypothetical protein
MCDRIEQKRQLKWVGVAGCLLDKSMAVPKVIEGNAKRKFRTATLETLDSSLEKETLSVVGAEIGCGGILAL